MLKKDKLGRIVKGNVAWNKGIKASETKVGAELGGTGTLVTNGYISSVDYNTEWTGTRRVTLIDKMRKGDATVRAAILAVTLPIMSANWFIKPASEDPADKELAERVSDMLFKGMDRTWQDTLREMLLYLVYGSMPFEIVYKQNEDGSVGWQKFAPRSPKTIWRWETENGERGITQMLPDGRTASIPWDKMVVLVNEQEGDNYEGNSIIRPAYSAWYNKDALYRIATIAAERQGVGLPYIILPSGSTDADEDKAEELLRNLRANEESFFIGRRTEDGQEVKPEIMNMNAGSNYNPVELIMHFDRQIVKAVMAQFLELGASGATGSRALSEDQSSMFLLNLKSVARHVAEQFTMNAIRPLCKMNWGETDHPTLEFSEIGDTDYQGLAGALSQFVNSGMLVPDRPLEEFIRENLDLPKKPDTPAPVGSVAEVVQMKERVDKVLDTIEGSLRQ